MSTRRTWIIVLFVTLSVVGCGPPRIDAPSDEEPASNSFDKMRDSFKPRAAGAIRPRHQYLCSVG